MTIPVSSYYPTLQIRRLRLTGTSLILHNCSCQNQDSNPGLTLYSGHSFPSLCSESPKIEERQKSICSGISSKPEKAPLNGEGARNQISRIQSPLCEFMYLKWRVAFCLLPYFTKKCNRACQLKNVFMTPENLCIGDMYFKQPFHHNRKKR